ncbi:uncharacterized protein LOC123541597 [Mercenaria mercenaria]|uniref:uncharacterized protein LOC123541597 n=1 Tax=Mercenaria mercenaria TaxID=6596 RepID=UPI00234E98D5|nr:uncharacterized protein LOC123541597 [Mercenaria mercenaria]
MGGLSNCFGYLCVTLKIMALISSLVGLGIPYWYQGDATESTGVSGTVKTTIREGLWKKCTVLEYTSTTSTFCAGNEVTTVINVIRWLVFIAAGVLGIGVLAAGAAHMEKNSTAFIVAAIHGFISAVVHTVATALYATVVKDDIGFETKHLYIGWGMIVLSMILTLLASVLALILARMVKSTKVESQGQE